MIFFFLIVIIYLHSIFDPCTGSSPHPSTIRIDIPHRIPRTIVVRTQRVVLPRQRIPCCPPAGEGVVVAGAEVGEAQTEAAVALLLLAAEAVAVVCRLDAAGDPRAEGRVAVQFADAREHIAHRIIGKIPIFQQTNQSSVFQSLETFFSVVIMVWF